MKQYFICFYERENANHAWKSVSVEEWDRLSVRGRFKEACIASFYCSEDTKIEWHEEEGGLVKIMGKFQIAALK